MENKKNEYFILNPFSKDGSNEELVKYENEDDALYNKINKTENPEDKNISGVEFNINQDEVSEELNNVLNINKEIILLPTIKKYITGDSLNIVVMNKKPPYLYFKLFLALIVFLLIVFSIFPSVQIIGSALVSAYVTSLCYYRREKRIVIEKKSLCVDKVTYPLQAIKSVNLAQKGEIFYEGNISIDFMSMHLMLDSFSNKKEDVVDTSNREGNNFRIVLEMKKEKEDKNQKMFVIADNLDKDEALVLFRELTR